MAKNSTVSLLLWEQFSDGILFLVESDFNENCWQWDLWIGQSTGDIVSLHFPNLSTTSEIPFMLIILAKQQKSDWDKNQTCPHRFPFGGTDPFPACVVGNARHHEGHLRHDGKMHIPCPQRGDAPSACRSILSGKCAGRSLHRTANISHSKEALEKRLHLFHLPFSPTEDG